MPTYTLTVLDTTGIQGYVFGSNVLRENIGGSELVRRATRLWPLEEVRAIGRTNVKADRKLNGDPDDLDGNRHIEVDGLDAEVIYAGGGNCVVLFADGNVARNFVTGLSCRVLAEAPDLDLVAAHVEVNWDADKGDILADKVKEALEHLARKKRDRRISTPLLGLGTTVACQSTGLPAVGVDVAEPGLEPGESPPPLSASILAKLRVWKEATLRLERLLYQFEEAGLRMPHDFDYFGRKEGEISYIAVVHADGNGMGKRVEALRKKFNRPEDNRPYIEAMRSFSRDVEHASKKALHDLSTRLLRHWDPAKEKDAIVGQTLDERSGKWVPVGKVQFGEKGKRLYIPFRPIVFGGDDLTFVTDGRLGLSLAAAYLEAFEEAIDALKNPHIQNLRACAGVAVVKAHYPFARAYDLSERLCINAKSEYQRQHSALDWHFAAAGLFGPISEIREQQYTIRAGHLEMRPLRLHPQAGEWRTWPGFAQVATEFLVGKDWKGKRNKVIALRDALRDGPDGVTQFRTAYGLKPLPLLTKGIDALQTTGWDGRDRCGYFDAIEALGFYVPLDWVEEIT